MRMTSSSRIGLPSSVTATAPARCKALKSVSISSLAALRCSSDREDIDHCPALGTPHPVDPFRRIDHRRRVGHRANGSEASRGSCGGAAGDRFLVTLSRLAQVDVQIDESGRDDQPASIELVVGAAADLIR